MMMNVVAEDGDGVLGINDDFASVCCNLSMGYVLNRIPYLNSSTLYTIYYRSCIISYYCK